MSPTDLLSVIDGSVDDFYAQFTRLTFSSYYELNSEITPARSQRVRGV